MKIFITEEGLSKASAYRIIHLKNAPIRKLKGSSIQVDMDKIKSFLETIREV